MASRSGLRSPPAGSGPGSSSAAGPAGGLVEVELSDIPLNATLLARPASTSGSSNTNAAAAAAAAGPATGGGKGDGLRASLVASRGTAGGSDVVLHPHGAAAAAAGRDGHNSHRAPPRVRRPSTGDGLASASADPFGANEAAGGVGGSSAGGGAELGAALRRHHHQQYDYDDTDIAMRAARRSQDSADLGSDASSSGSPHVHAHNDMPLGHHSRSLTVIGVIALLFFNVSGGGFGTEQIIGVPGPAIGLTCLFIFPWLWCIPVSLTVAELGCAFPCDGGPLVWVTQAFGHFWGFQMGMWGWAAGVTDNALYPILVLDVFTQIVPVDSWFLRYLIKLVVTWILTIPTLFGLKVMDRFLSTLAVVVMAPFLLLAFYGLPTANFRILSEYRQWSDIDWVPFFHTLFWNFNGFGIAGNVGGEIMNPNKNIPRALFSAVMIITTFYFLILSVATANNSPPWTTWTDGSFSAIGQAIGGDWMAVGLMISSAIGTIGLFNTEIVGDAFSLVGMAENQLVPAIFARRNNKYEAPRHALMASCVIVSVLVMLDWNTVLAIDNVLSCCSLFLMLLAAARLRYSHGHVERPFKMPQSDRAFGLMLVPPTIIVILVMSTVAARASVSGTLTIAVAVAMVGVYFILHWRRFPFLQRLFRARDQTRFSVLEADNDAEL